MKSLPPAGIVGLGLMGTSISTALLVAGHAVTGVESDAGRRRLARRRVRAFLDDMVRRGRLRKGLPERLMKAYTVAPDFDALAGAGIVIESITESVARKREAIRSIEQVIAADALIGSNTSAIPVTQLQAEAEHPERVLGIHWAEPAHATRFMEIICGDRTAPESAARAVALARHWGKEPTLVKRDVRGFLTNRIMYAMLREACYLVEQGYATPADVDRSIRNDLGWWITLAGPFRIMDLHGVSAFATVMKDLLPDLCRDTEVPQIMQDMERAGAKGVANAKGFYPYTPRQARQWEKVYLEFTYDIRKLAEKYPEDIGDRPPRRKARK